MIVFMMEVCVFIANIGVFILKTQKKLSPFKKKNDEKHGGMLISLYIFV